MPRKWPKPRSGRDFVGELAKPIVLTDEMIGVSTPASAISVEFRQRVWHALVRQRNLKVPALAAHYGIAPPRSAGEHADVLLHIVHALAADFVPGFAQATAPARAGQKKTEKWSDLARWFLLADVAYLKSKNPKLTDHAACAALARLSWLYPKTKSSSLYRVFTESKGRNDNDKLFRGAIVFDEWRSLYDTRACKWPEHKCVGVNAILQKENFELRYPSVSELG
jgi:hypothetical protein